jgi:MraZ protein
MYRGATHLNLDEKGRFSMPARYREEILASCDGRLVITVDTAHCLMVYPYPQWEKIEAALMSHPNMDKQVRRLQRLLVGYAAECDMSAQGRILVSPSLRKFAGLDKQVTLVGQGNKFELWDAARWEMQTELWLKEEDELEGTSDALMSLSL